VDVVDIKLKGIAPHYKKWACRGAASAGPSIVAGAVTAHAFGARKLCNEEIPSAFGNVSERANPKKPLPDKVLTDSIQVNS
jgi:hypothetical protein